MSNGKVAVVREPTVNDRRNAENYARRVHPNMAASYIIQEEYDRELARQVTTIDGKVPSEKELLDLPDPDLQKIMGEIALCYLPDKRREEVRAFLEAQRVGKP